MSSLLETLKQNGFNTSPTSDPIDDPINEPIEESEIETTVDHSNFSEADFENTTGLPTRMMNMTMFELVKRYGGEMQLKGWADILNKLMTAMEKDQKSQERRNELVEKDFIISNVKKYLDLFLSNLFDVSESQKPIIDAIYKTDPEAAQKKVEELRNKSYTKISREAVRSINGSIKGLKRKYEDDKD